ncbi:hypothetical protein ACT4MK_36910 [Bradyrhizobium barranii]|uniref:hypothetical protein n=1 Tax=Bradyrhizobium TaxID=374 RepID=UPI003F2918AA
MSASWHDPTLVALKDKAQFLPGQKLTISLTGSIDVNPEEHSDCNKDWLGQCHRTYWTEHHYRNPGQTPATFHLARTDGQGQPISFVVGGSSVQIDIPVTGKEFDKPFELRGYIAAPGSGVDAARSLLSYSVSITVDARQRVDALTSFFAARSPTAAEIVDNSKVVDAISANQFGSLCAQKIRTFAATNFPISSGKSAQESQLMILQYAKRLAPQDSANTQALADFYNAVGLASLAEAEYNKTIAQQEQQAKLSQSVKDKVVLAELTGNMGAMIAQNAGSFDPGALQRADTFFDRAASIYQSVNFSDRRGGALAARASVLRRLRTIGALQSSIDLYQRASTSMARTVVGDVAVRSSDGRTLLTGASYSGYRIVDIGTGRTHSDYWKTGQDFNPVAWDAANQRILLRSADTLVWRDPFDPTANVVPATAALADRFVASSSTIIGISNADGTARAITKGGSDLRLRVENEDVCEYRSVYTQVPSPNPAAPMFKTYGPTVLSFDGKIVAITCGARVGVFAIEDEKLRSLGVFDAAKFTGRITDIISVALSPDGTKLALIARSAPNPSMPAAPGRPPAWDDRAIVSDVLNPPQSPKEIPLAAELKTPRMPVLNPLLAIAFGPDGQSLAISSGLFLQLASLTDGSSVIKALSYDRDASVRPRILSPYEPYLSIERSSATEFFIKDWMSGGISLVDWPSRTVRSVAIDQSAASELAVGTIVTRNNSDGPHTFWIGQRQFLELTHSIASKDASVESLPSSIKGEISSVGQPPLLLTGSSYLVGREPFSRSTTVIQIGKSQQAIPLPKGNDVGFVLALGSPDSWARVSLDRQAFQATVEFMRGFDKVGETSLPPVPNSYKDHLLANWRAIVDTWGKNGRPQFVDPNERFLLTQPRDVEEAIGHTERLLVGWRPALTVGNAILPNGNDNLGPVVFQPFVRYTTLDGRPLEVLPTQTMYAVVDPKAMSTSDTIALVDFHDTIPLAILNETSAIVVQVKPGPNGQMSSSFFTRSLKSEILSPIQTRLSDIGAAGAAPSLQSYQVASDGILFDLVGFTPKSPTFFEPWLESFSLKGSVAQPMPCRSCVDLDASELPRLLGSINRSVVASFGNLSPLMLSSSLRTSVDLKRQMSLAGKLLEVIDIPSNSVLLSTGAALPRAIEGNVAVIQESPHLLKVYSLN